MRGLRQVTGSRVVARIASGIVAVGLLVGSAGGAGAQASPESDAELAPTFDLGAVLLPVDSFPLDDLTIVSGTLVTAEEFADGFDDPDAVFEALTDGEFLARHQTFYGTISDEDENQYAWTARTYVSEFGDADGAEAAFEVLEDESEDADAEDVDFPDFGDQSELTRSTGMDAGDREFTSFDFAAQVDAVHVGFTVTLWEISGLTEDDIDIADLETVAGELLEQLDVAQEREAGVFFQGPRFVAGEGFATTLVLEDYLVLDEAFYPHLTDPEQNEEEQSEVIDQYRLQTFGNPEGSEGLETEIALIGEATLLTDADAVADYIAARSDPDGLESAGYTAIEPIEDAGALPDGDGEVVGYTYEYDLGELTASGVQFYVQVDDVVIGVAADGASGVDVDVVLELMEDAVACAEDGDFCAPLAVPEEIAG